MTQENKPDLLSTGLASDTLKKIGSKNKDEVTKVREILEDFHENGILLAMLFFAVPAAIPLPYPPGFTTVMGLPLIFLSIQMIFGSKRIWLPSSINNYELKNSTLSKISEKVVPTLVMIEKYIKPRYKFAHSVYCEQAIGLLCLIAAISVIIPLPFTNAIPAQGISVLSLGLLNRDGVIIVVGAVIAIVGVVVALAAMTFGWIIVQWVLQKVF